MPVRSSPKEVIVGPSKTSRLVILSPPDDCLLRLQSAGLTLIMPQSKRVASLLAHTDCHACSFWSTAGAVQLCAFQN